MEPGFKLRSVWNHKPIQLETAKWDTGAQYNTHLLRTLRTLKAKISHALRRNYHILHFFFIRLAGASKELRTQTYSQATWFQTPILFLTSCVTLSKLLHFSVPWCLHLKMGILILLNLYVFYKGYIYMWYWYCESLF